MNSGDISYLLNNYFSFFLRGIASTILLSLLGTFGGLLLGVFLAFGMRVHIEANDPWYHKAWKRLIQFLCHAYSILIRGTPMMVQAMIFKYGCQAMGLNWNAIAPGIAVFDGWFYAGLIVITLNTAAYMGEIVKSGLNGVGSDPTEGALSLGMSRGETLFLVELPQALRNAIPTIGNEWIVNIKDSSVLNVIGVAELYFMSGQAANKSYRTIAAFVIVAVIYLLLTLITTGLLKLVERKLDGKPFVPNFFHFNSKKSQAAEKEAA